MKSFSEPSKCRIIASSVSISYRVQKVSSLYYVFRYHLETSVTDDKNTLGRIPKFHRVRSLADYEKRNIRKVRVDLLGRISLL